MLPIIIKCLAKYQLPPEMPSFLWYVFQVLTLKMIKHAHYLHLALISSYLQIISSLWLFWRAQFIPIFTIRFCSVFVNSYT